MLAKRIIPCLDVMKGRVRLVRYERIHSPIISGERLYGKNILSAGLAEMGGLA